MKPASVSTKQERIAELARENPAMAFTSLNQYLDAEWLEYAFECTRKDGAVGVDGQTAESYAANLQQNLASLIERLKSGRYRAPPVRRHYIPKAGGGERGLGIPAFEDKVAQRAITLLLEPIYEQTFLDCSFGYRPARNAHQALQVLRTGIMKWRGYWVLEVDIRKYFDSIPFAALRECLAKRVTDGVVRKLIDKWLKAGVLEAGQVHYPEAGTPQGGVIAERVLAVLDKRVGRFGLQLHPDKTRLVDFRPRRSVGEIEESTLPTTFNFLGFTHVWGRSRRGSAVVRQLTAKDRLARSLKAINQRCKRMRHWPLRAQHQRLCRVLKGHYAYFGISGNYKRLRLLHQCVRRLWHRWLSRRSSKSYVLWERYLRMLERFALPSPKIVHAYAIG